MVYQFGDPNLCWQVWKSLLLDALNRHAPLRHKRIRNDPVPWINPQIKELMRKRDYHKKKAIKYDSESQWELYKTLRNEQLNKLVLMYKVLGNHTAPNLKDLFSRRNASQNIYDLRNSETDLSLKKPKTEFLKKTFGYSGAILWNSLPQDVKAAESITSFKTMAKLHLSR